MFTNFICNLIFGRLIFRLFHFNFDSFISLLKSLFYIYIFFFYTR